MDIHTGLYSQRALADVTTFMFIAAALVRVKKDSFGEVVITDIGFHSTASASLKRLATRFKKCIEEDYEWKSEDLNDEYVFKFTSSSPKMILSVMNAHIIYDLFCGKKRGWLESKYPKEAVDKLFGSRYDPVLREAILVLKDNIAAVQNEAKNKEEAVNKWRLAENSRIMQEVCDKMNLIAHEKDEQIERLNSQINALVYEHEMGLLHNAKEQ